MGESSRRHAAVLAELVEWWEDVSREGIGSRCVLVPVPPGWGRSTLLNRFAAVVEADELGGVIVRIAGALLPEGAGVQAGRLAGLLDEARRSPPVAELVGVDRLGGAIQQGLGVGGLLVSPPVAAGMLAAGIGVGVAGKQWDRSAAGREGALARAARAVAALSVRVPVAVLVDDADQLDPQLAVTLAESLIERHDGWVLVVAVAAPGSRLIRELRSGPVRVDRGPGTGGRGQRGDGGPGPGGPGRGAVPGPACAGGAADRAAGAELR